MRTSPIIALAAAAAASGCGVSADPAERVSTESARIVGGADDANDPSVVDVGAEGGVFCSGTVISPHVVVTAAHCLEDGPTHVYFGDRHLGVAWTRAHPGFDEATLDNDVAALVLDAAAPVDAAPLRSAPVAIGDAVRVVGFGAASTRSAGTSRVTAVDATTFTTRPDPAQPCGGDSGGAALATRDGVTELAGIVSAGDAGCRQFAVFTRVDAFRGFLAPIVADAEPSSSGCAAAPRRPSFAVLVLVAAAALRRARASRNKGRPWERR